MNSSKHFKYNDNDTNFFYSSWVFCCLDIWFMLIVAPPNKTSWLRHWKTAETIIMSNTILCRKCMWSRLPRKISKFDDYSSDLQEKLVWLSICSATCLYNFLLGLIYGPRASSHLTIWFTVCLPSWKFTFPCILQV